MSEFVRGRVVEIPGSNAAVIDGLAEHAGLTPEEYLEQGIVIVLFCAEQAVLNQQVDRTTAIYFEMEPDVYEGWLFPLVLEEAVRVESGQTSLDDLEVVDPFLVDQPEAVEIGLNEAQEEKMRHWAPLLGITLDDFIENALYLRWQWALARQKYGRVLIEEVDGTFVEVNANF